jgi:energy-coupling factor transport system ATP-binding protein
MAMNPKVLILDEPTAGLDPRGRDKVLNEIKQYHKAQGNTVLLVSHSMEDVAKYADRVLVMNKGKVAMFDTTEKVFARAEELATMGLAVPQVTRICRGLADRGLNIDPNCYTIEQAVAQLLALRTGKGADQNA